MIVALIDNGSLEAAAYRNLRAGAKALSTTTGVAVHAVSWRHSDRISREALDDTPAWTLVPFVRAMFALGQREFVFVPFFISPQGAIGSALHGDLEKLRAQLGDFDFSFTDGLATRGVLPAIICDRVRATIATRALRKPSVVVVDHGGPSATSAELRDQIAAEVRVELGATIGDLAAASMEGAHGPLLDEVLRFPNLNRREIVLAPLFLSPGRHAGPEGDVVRIARAAHPRVHVTKLIGDHPRAIETLADGLREHLAARELTLTAGANRDVN